MRAVQLRRSKFRKIFKTVHERADYTSRRRHLIPERPTKRGLLMRNQVGSNVMERFERRLTKRCGLPTFYRRVRKKPFWVKIYHKVEHRCGNGRIPQRKMFRKDRLQSAAPDRRYGMICRFSEHEYSRMNPWMFIKNHTVTYNNPCQYRISKKAYDEFLHIYSKERFLSILKDEEVFLNQAFLTHFPELEKKMCHDGFLGHYDYYTLKYCENQELVKEVIDRWREHE